MYRGVRRLLMAVLCVLTVMGAAAPGRAKDGEPAGEAGTAVHRLNAGGGRISSTPAWEPDDAFSTSSRTRSEDTDGDVSPADGEPGLLYDTERTTSRRSLAYKLPVEHGDYEVRLFFSEEDGWRPAPGRRMDIIVNGQVVEKNFSARVEAGLNVGVVVAHAVKDVRTIEIRLRRGDGSTGDIQINGVEVRRLGDESTPPSPDAPVAESEPGPVDGEGQPEQGPDGAPRPGGPVTAFNAAVVGEQLDVTYTVSATGRTEFADLLIALRDASGKEYDFGWRGGEVVDGSKTYSGARSVLDLPVGDYSVFVEYHVDGEEWARTPQEVRFTVGGPEQPGTPYEPGSQTTRSGEAMPVGDLPGWTQVYTQDFDEDVALGNWPGPYTDTVDYYADGTPDTRGQQGGPGQYFPSDVISVADGVLRKHLHTDGDVAKVAAILPIIPGEEHGFIGQRYGRYAVRFRADALEDYKLAWLLWPTSDDWNDGEIDFPEGHLPDTIEGFSHEAGTGNPERNALAVDAGEGFGEWHTAVIEWTPGRVEFFLDGRSVGHTTANVPTTPMRWTLQTETSLSTDPHPSVAGDVEIDWMAVWTRQ